MPCLLNVGSTKRVPDTTARGLAPAACPGTATPCESKGTISTPHEPTTASRSAMVALSMVDLLDVSYSGRCHDSVSTRTASKAFAVGSAASRQRHALFIRVEDCNSSRRASGPARCEARKYHGSVTVTNKSWATGTCHHASFLAWYGQSGRGYLPLALPPWTRWSCAEGRGVGVRPLGVLHTTLPPSQKRLAMASISHVVACEVELALCHRVLGARGGLSRFRNTNQFHPTPCP